MNHEPRQSTDRSASIRFSRQLKNAGTAYLYVYAFETLLREYVYTSLRKTQPAPVVQSEEELWLNPLLDNVKPNLGKELDARLNRHVKAGLYLAITDHASFSFLNLSELQQLVLVNWNICGHVFRDKIQFEAACKRITFIRNSIAHSRSINDDVLDDVKTSCAKFIQALLGDTSCVSRRDIPFSIDFIQDLFNDRHSDVVRVFPTRNNFQQMIGYESFFVNALSIDAIGLSLNAVTLSFGVSQLQRVLEEENSRVRLLFLDPNGKNTASREQEEGYEAGEISQITRTNLAIIRKLRASLREECQERLQIRLYDETLRLNIYIVDNEYMISQHYLPVSMGVDSPCLLIKRSSEEGLYHQYEKVFESIWKKSSEWNAL